ncbi:MAG: hypothetical protein KatS3mg057_1475 [Herpetosiphonaceae bacterium]|nr:MAG: hypothetical protein KatS3mg057_1475 [Herpetosiphonaceae bacterium]
MEYRLDFDPQLPMLALAFDLDAVARLFEQRWPRTSEHSAGAPLTIERCRLQDVKYQPGVRCVTTYELLAEEPGAGRRQTIGVLEISPAGAEHRLFDADPQLPWLVAASHAGEMRGRFAGLAGEDGELAAITECAITPIRYKPALRCVFRYDLRLAGASRVFYGKLLAQGGLQLSETIRALHRLSRMRPELPRILPLLAYWPDLRLLIQPAVEGGVDLNVQAFSTAESSAAREQLLAEAGARLAALHASEGVAGQRRTIEDDLRELREYIAPMAQAARDLAADYERAIAALERAAGKQDEPAPVASHGAFRTDQFMVEDGRLVMIDLDSFCWANPARDVGNVLAYLRWKALRQPQQADFIERAGRACIAGYAAVRRPPDERWMAICQAASLLKIAGRRFRSLSINEWPLVPHLLDEVWVALEQA